MTTSIFQKIINHVLRLWFSASFSEKHYFSINDAVIDWHVLLKPFFYMCMCLHLFACVFNDRITSFSYRCFFFFLLCCYCCLLFVTKCERIVANIRRLQSKSSSGAYLVIPLGKQAVRHCLYTKLGCKKRMQSHQYKNEKRQIPTEWRA